jgi:hypothetical protein
LRGCQAFFVKLLAQINCLKSIITKKPLLVGKLTRAFVKLRVDDKQKIPLKNKVFFKEDLGGRRYTITCQTI